MVNNSLKQGKMLSILARWVLLDACMHVVFLMKEEDAQEPVVTCFEFGFHSSVSFSQILCFSLTELWRRCGIMLISNEVRKMKINESLWDCEIGVNTHLSTEPQKTH